MNYADVVNIIEDLKITANGYQEILEPDSYLEGYLGAIKDISNKLYDKYLEDKHRSK